MKTPLSFAAATVLGLLVFHIEARADVIFTPGNNPLSNEENVLLLGQTGNPVFGVTSVTSSTVQFTSTVNATLTEVMTAGPPRVKSAVANLPLLHDVSITVPNGTYQSLIFNAFVEGPPGADCTVTVKASDGTFTYSFPGGLAGFNANNFLTITTTNGETISDTTIDSNKGFLDIRQMAMDDIAPEPGSLALAGIGVLSCAVPCWLRRRK
jgi:hypothetical protein